MKIEKKNCFSFEAINRCDVCVSCYKRNRQEYTIHYHYPFISNVFALNEFSTFKSRATRSSFSLDNLLGLLAINQNIFMVIRFDCVKTQIQTRKCSICMINALQLSKFFIFLNIFVHFFRAKSEQKAHFPCTFIYAISANLCQSFYSEFKEKPGCIYANDKLLFDFFHIYLNLQLKMMHIRIVSI